MDGEDSINLETLQAQIDMSMAFAEEMVSSWVKPSRKLSRRSNRDPEAELKEYMRRPPRLGVGAAIPETANFSRDTARLKGQLVGKGNKRPRENEPDSKEKDSADSEEEIRGRVIKKKARVDPFANDGKKKKKQKAAPPLGPEPSTPEEAEEELREVVNMVTEGVTELSTPLATPKRKKHKKKHPITESSLDAIQTPASSLSLQLSVKKSTTVPPKNQFEQSIPSTEGKVVDISTTTTSATPLELRRQAQSAALLKFPLLNLIPVKDDDSEHEDDAHDSSPKKKRRRKKKKKKKSDASGSCVLENSAALS